ncbi:hypothetical protein [Gorillibacterium sp. sgz5001074]|uniref:hypothetical protein n=1 Tax=Gorillibacterium sp. sgz5001074 TaxID=3446695 RepID=UPI003F67A15A
MAARSPIIQRKFAGIDRRDAFSIPDICASDGYNFSTSEYPALTIKPGFAILATISRVQGLGVWKETELLSIFADGSMWKWNGSAFTSVTTGLNVGTDYSFCNFKGGFSDITVLLTNGNGVSQYSGGSVTTLSGPPAGLKYIEQYADRVWGIVNNRLHASGFRNASDWTSVSTTDEIDDSVSFYAEIESNDGESITALKSGLGRLVVFKPSAMYELRGYAPSDYRVDPISTDIGAINNQCIAVLQSGMYFLDSKGIYLYRGDGVAPQKGFSKQVQWYIDHMNQSAKQTCAVGTDGKRLYVSIPMIASYPDTLLVYDPEEKTWDVDKSHSAVHFANMGANTYIGDYNGSVRQLGASTDSGTPISWRWVSKPFTAPSMSQRVRWIQIWLTLDLPAGSTLSVYLSPSASGNDWVQAGATVIGTGTIQRRPIYFPSNVIPISEQVRVKFEGTGPFTIYEFARDEVTMPLR